MNIHPLAGRAPIPPRDGEGGPCAAWWVGFNGEARHDVPLIPAKAGIQPTPPFREHKSGFPVTGCAIAGNERKNQKPQHSQAGLTP